MLKEIKTVGSLSVTEGHSEILQRVRKKPSQLFSSTPTFQKFYK